MKKRLEAIDLMLSDVLFLLDGVSTETISSQDKLQQAQDLLWATKIVIAQSSPFLQESPDCSF